MLDSSSGNAGIAHAMIGRIVGVPVEILMPDNATVERKKRIVAHGGRLIFTEALKGYDEALREVRLARGRPLRGIENSHRTGEGGAACPVEVSVSPQAAVATRQAAQRA